MKTALQELIERLEQNRNANLFDNPHYKSGLGEAISLATELLEKEKEEIEKAVNFGLELAAEARDAEQYYLGEDEPIEGKQVDYQKMFANCKLPDEKSRSSFSDWAKDLHFCKIYGFRKGIDKCSGCDQDK